MRRGLPAGLSYANIISTLALIAALGGASYAIAKGQIKSHEIKNNAVRSLDLRNNNVRSVDIRNSTVTTRDVRDGGLLARDFRPGQLPVGPRGEQGPAGEDATSLFAYIRDAGGIEPEVAYGSGVTAVEVPEGGTEYMVTFSQSVVGCVVQVTNGIGDPPGGASAPPSFAQVVMSAGNDSEVQVQFFNAGGVATTTSFLVTAFC